MSASDLLSIPFCSSFTV
uniref:Uncharacterized protein n=1 Tax=Arundo donax TaxID=35708 RepID=A0A0A9ACL3_ARUDO